MADLEPERATIIGSGSLALAADHWPAPGGRPVILMHGGGQTRHAWGETGRALAARGYEVVSLDLRGHGDSGWAHNGDYSFTTFAADCIAVCDQLERPPVLVGASLGGVAAILAEGNSDRVVSCGLVIVDITSQSNAAGIQRIKDFMASGLGGFATLEEAADAIAAYTPHRKRAPNPAGLAKVLRLGADKRWHWHWDPRFIDRGRAEVPGPEFQALFEVALAHVRVPTLLVRGKLSDVVTEEGVKDFLARVPHAKLADVSGAAHMVAGDQNDVFSTAVIEFLENDVRPGLMG